ncbi:hypothetical protein GYA27_00910 [candidate division WWE3 bacterium]|uniref:Uncharacterized protein n=1 Tax=candidate division WWE3 bacterium TaxID=2053526 RepID=A0A7X9DJQ4_UNCKA|nr:hypothetical protein [candidate division WWE3 bacterium]
MQRLTLEEREVHLWFDDVDRVWRAEASILKYIRAFRKAGWKELCCDNDDNGTPVVATFEAPAHAISIRKAERKKRVMTEEQRVAAIERLSLARNSLKISEKPE